MHCALDREDTALAYAAQLTRDVGRPQKQTPNDTKNRQQVIAWEDKDASSLPPNSSDNGRSAGVILRYGVVVVGGSVEAGEGGGDDDDVPGGDRKGPGGEGLRYVRVKLTPGRVDTLLSTQVIKKQLLRHYDATALRG